MINLQITVPANLEYFTPWSMVHGPAKLLISTLFLTGRGDVTQMGPTVS